MIKKVWDNLEEYILVPMLAFSAILLFFQVIMRYIFSNSLSWSEELARFLYIWEVWLGIAYCTKKKSHLRITLVFNLVKENIQFYIQLLVNVLWFGFGIFMIRNGANTMLQIMNHAQRSSAMQIPMWLVYLAIPTGSFLMDIHLIEDTVQMFRKRKGALRDV